MGIDQVIYQRGYDSHENNDRTIATLVNGDIDGFSPEQVRVTKFNRNTSLGNHWREYPELYGVIGQAKVTLEDIDTKERRNYDLKTGDRLLVPSRVALKIEASEGTVIITCCPKAARDEKTHKYEIK